MLPKDTAPATGKGPPVIEEGTDDFGSDRVELQVRDVVEVLLAGSGRPSTRTGGRKESRCHITRHHVPGCIFFLILY